MHVTREEFYGEIAKVTDWVARENHADRHRMSRLEQWMEIIMGVVTDDIGVLAGLANQLESIITSQKSAIDALTKKDSDDVAAGAADHQELLDSHTALSAVAQQFRDIIAAAAPPEQVSGANPSVGEQAPPDATPPNVATAPAQATGAPGGPATVAPGGSAVDASGDPLPDTVAGPASADSTTSDSSSSSTSSTSSSDGVS